MVVEHNNESSKNNLAVLGQNSPVWDGRGSYSHLRGWPRMRVVFSVGSGCLLVVKMGLTAFRVRIYDGENEKGHIAGKQQGILTQQPTVYVAGMIAARGGGWWAGVRCSRGATAKGNVAGRKIPLSGSSAEGGCGSSFVSCQNNAKWSDRQTLPTRDSPV
jgi:hypothetical protein